MMTDLKVFSSPHPLSHPGATRSTSIKTDQIPPVEYINVFFSFFFVSLECDVHVSFFLPYILINT